MLKDRPVAFFELLALIAVVFALLLISFPKADRATAASSKSSNAASQNSLGPKVKIGNGFAQTFVHAGDRGQPVAFGVQFSASMLENLPAKPNGDPALDWHYFLTFPRGGPSTGFDHLMIDWHPMGHLPKGIYTVPHFDFHFYQISQKDQLAIHYPKDESPEWTGIIFPKASLMPAGYFIPPASQVSRMGIHAISMAAPEMNGKPFSNTFIYGYYRGRLIFIEPMITLAYLRGRHNDSMDLSTPPSYSYPGWFPSRYRTAYDAKTGMYSLVLDSLKHWEPEKRVARARR